MKRVAANTRLETFDAVTGKLDFSVESVAGSMLTGARHDLLRPIGIAVKNHSA